jgi:hypothetical protein
MQSIPVGKPMEMLGMDFMGPFPETMDGNRYILVIGDYFTKWTEAFAVKDQTALTTAGILWEEVISRHGVPLVLHSDQGRNFESKVVKELCKLTGMEKVRTTPYHPQCDGLVERLNQTLVSILSKVVDESERDWDKKLPAALFAYRTTRQETTGQTPFRLVCGREARIPVSTVIEGDDDEEVWPATEYGKEVERQLAMMDDFVDLRIEEAQARQRRAYDEKSTEAPVYEKGDWVWLHSPGHKKGASRKLCSPYKGPFVILEKLNQSNVKVCGVRGGRPKRVHCDRLKIYYRRPFSAEEDEENPLGGDGENETDESRGTNAGNKDGDRQSGVVALDRHLNVGSRDFVPRLEADFDDVATNGNGGGRVEPLHPIEEAGGPVADVDPGRVPRAVKPPAYLADYVLDDDMSGDDVEDDAS